MAVRVLIVDPQPFFCRSLAAALSRTQDIEVVGWSTDEVEGARLASDRSPDVVLTEMVLDTGSGLSLARRVDAGRRVVILTREHEGDVLLDAVASGAAGCVSHELDVADLAALVTAAAEGRFAVHPERLHDALRRASAARSSDRPDGHPRPLSALTAREREVLQLLSTGLDNQGIARALHVSTHTARTHVGNILRKLEVHSRADAARLALREGRATGDEEVLRIRGPNLRGT